MSWWGVDLDPITMAAMIISIGFSIDIPAHVSYHYYQACNFFRIFFFINFLALGTEVATPKQKLTNCMSSVAFPAVQAGLSTILCVSSLLFVHLYMAEVIFLINCFEIIIFLN